MTEREQLLQILNTPIHPHLDVDPLEAVADFLLDNGVKIPVLCRDCKDHDRCEVEDLLIYFNPKIEPYCVHGERKSND